MGCEFAAADALTSLEQPAVDAIRVAWGRAAGVLELARFVVAAGGDEGREEEGEQDGGFCEGIVRSAELVGEICWLSLILVVDASDGEEVVCFAPVDHPMAYCL